MGSTSTRLQKRFLMLALPGLAVVLAGVGVGFLASSGTVTAPITASSANSTYVYPVSATTVFPTRLGTASLKYSATLKTTHKLTTVTQPSWVPAQGGAGSVTTAGDLAVINASATTIQLSVFLLNLAKLGHDYSSYAFPIHVWKATLTGTPSATAASWTTGNTLSPKISSQYMTSTSGYLTFKLAAGFYYDVTMTTGGAFFCQTTSTTTGALAPSFYFAAQPV